jgi:hypothetical protein
VVAGSRRGATNTSFSHSTNIDGMAADILEGSNQPIAALLASTVITVVLGLCIRKNLGRRYREALNQAEDQGPAPPRQPVAA